MANFNISYTVLEWLICLLAFREWTKYQFHVWALSTKLESVESDGKQLARVCAQWKNTPIGTFKSSLITHFCSICRWRRRRRLAVHSPATRAPRHAAFGKYTCTVSRTHTHTLPNTLLHVAQTMTRTQKIWTMKKTQTHTYPHAYRHTQFTERKSHSPSLC